MTVYDIGGVLGELPVHTRRQVGSFNGCVVGVARRSEPTAWERHPAGEEMVYVLEGAIEVTIIADGRSSIVTVAAGSVVVVPRAAWHRFRPHAPTALLYVTPTEGTERSEAEQPPA
jgi:mannose-6-phosphate isomerase-like protein (cupin superfamily)